MSSVLPSLKQMIHIWLDRPNTRFVRWTRPLNTSLRLGTIADLGRSKSELMTVNALLRQQLIMLKRQVKRQACTNADRLLLVLPTPLYGPFGISVPKRESKQPCRKPYLRLPDIERAKKRKG